MTHALVSFIGRVGGTSEAYETVTYQLPGASPIGCALFAHALRLHLLPDQFIVLGTTASMWEHLADDVLADMPAAAQAEVQHASLRLITERAANAVRQESLDALAQLLTQAMACDVRLHLVPDAHAAPDQIELVARLDQITASATELTFDVTHGYRHLPLLLFVTALYLRSVRPELSVRGVWYASLQPGESAARVSDLAPLLEIVDWMNAVQRLDWIGDYGAVAPLLADLNIARHLQTATFLQATHQGRVADELKKARSRLAHTPTTGAGRLFERALLERVRWIDGDIQAHQRRQAYAALDRGDHLRAGLQAFEAFISHLVVQVHPNDAAALHDARKRESAQHDFEGARRDARQPAYEQLKRIRNRLAHGTASGDAKVRAAMQSPAALTAALRQCMHVLIPD